MSFDEWWTKDVPEGMGRAHDDYCLSKEAWDAAQDDAWIDIKEIQDWHIKLGNLELMRQKLLAENFKLSAESEVLREWCNTAIASEREACAKVCEAWLLHDTSYDCAYAIRARSDKEK